ncbi:hypothetical protein pVa21_072 [Vibrio phage pVa-21]|nr:hypothetical protein pVa21_072 [Vibrio phage pVa-21]
MTTNEQTKSATELLILKDFEVSLPEVFVAQMAEQKTINVYAAPHQGKNLGAALIVKAIGGTTFTILEENCHIDEVAKRLWSTEPGEYDNMIIDTCIQGSAFTYEPYAERSRMFLLKTCQRDESVIPGVNDVIMSIDDNVFFTWRNRETGKVEVIEYDVNCIPSLT